MLIRRRLCVSVLAVDRFRDSLEACYGIFDGDRNEEVPRLLQCTMGDVLCEELQHSGVDSVFMCNTFLMSHRWAGFVSEKASCTFVGRRLFPQRFLTLFLFVVVTDRKLGMAGQKLGASALLCYVHRDPSEPGGVFSLTVANVGTCQAVLCRDGRPVPLSKVYSLENCSEERERVKVAKAIITEVVIVNVLLGAWGFSPSEL